MGWPGEDGNGSSGEEPSVVKKDETEGKRKKKNADGSQEKSPTKRAETPEELKKRCLKIVARGAKKGKPLSALYARIQKKHGPDVLSYEEAENVYREQEAKSTPSRATPVDGTVPPPPPNVVVEPETVPPPAPVNPTAEQPSDDTLIVADPPAAAASGETAAVPSPAKKRHRNTEKESGDGVSSRKKKPIGRPPDEEKQRTIIATVENNPSISLRSVASSLDCSKSQVARVLALNGFQRNKGRVGEWQRVNPEEDHALKQDAAADAASTKDSEAATSSTSSTSVKPESKPTKGKSRPKADKTEKSEQPTRDSEDESPSVNEDQQLTERPSKKKRTSEE